MGVRTKGLLFFFFCACFIPQGYAQESSKLDSASFKYLWYDPEKIVTGIADADRCAACHKLEYQRWETTKHATQFKTLHETNRAKGISKRMGFPFMQFQSLCVKCHYTGVIRDGELNAVFGVSCQSCHGPARDWIEIHNKWGEGRNHDTETPEHKAKRIAEAKAAGMLRPSELYGVVANCYQCHTVPHEELVNKGEHPVGSSGFDFLNRVDEIRHNFVHTQFNAADTSNRLDAPERRRVMFVVGRAVDLEFSVRAVASATVEGTYSKSIVDRAGNAAVNLQLVTSVMPIPEVTEILKIANRSSLKPNNKISLLGAADRMRDQTKALIKRLTNNKGEINDGGTLARLDNLIAGKEEPVPEAVKPSTGETPTRTTSPQVSARQQSSGADYEIRAHIRPYLRQTTGHRTVGPSNCTGCHKEQNEWAKNDRHLQSLDKLVSNPKAMQIAGKYYKRAFNATSISTGSIVCMDCHGTVITGQTAFPARYGASCESCHGPSSDFKEKHSNDNPPHGYSVGKEYGMLVLEEPEVWAEACAQCHYITDPRLIASGHPGDTFKERNLEIVEASKKIFHWPKGPSDVPSALKTAFDQVKGARGPIPSVTPLVLASTTSGQEAPTASVDRIVSSPTATTSIIPKNIEPESLPALSDSVSIEERLLILKKRFEELYRLTGGGR